MCSDGIMDAAGPKPCAGMPGTTMLVEDMFYNVPARQKAIRSGSEEHSRILDMVGRYAVFATAVGIMVKRHGEARPDLHTTANAGQLDAIRRHLAAIRLQHSISMSVAMRVNI